MYLKRLIVFLLLLFSIIDLSAQSWPELTSNLWEEMTPSLLLEYLDHNDVNFQDSNGKTALIFAASYCQEPEVIKLLVKTGAKINVRDNWGSAGSLGIGGWTALMWAARLNPNPAIVKVLIDAGADIKTQRIPTPELIEEIVKADLEFYSHSGFDKIVDRKKLEESASEAIIGWSVIMAASFNKNPDVIDALIEAGADVNARSGGGETALMYTVSFNNNAAVIRSLIAAGAQVNAQRKDGFTALMLAAAGPEFFQDGEKPDPTIIKILLDAGADLHIQTESGLTALMAASMFNQSISVLDNVNILIEGGADVNTRDHFGSTALIFGSEYNHNAELIEALLKAGANINARNEKGQTALMVAAQHNRNPAIIDLLMSAGADISIKSNEGKTAFNYAQSNLALIGTSAYYTLSKRSIE